MTLPAMHGWTHRPKSRGGTDPVFLPGYYEIKVFADRGALDGNLPDSAIIVSVGDGKFIWEIPTQLDGTKLSYVRIFLSVAGSGDVLVQLHNITQAVDMLTTRAKIDAGDLSSLTSATPVVISTTNDLVADGDQIRVDVDSAGGGDAEGLGLVAGFE